ncbi:DUF2603 domain-containing protein [uncultured Helicobacter sp.]|uniref:DUF2603 domain-containing protein n=1 Tax=uncultured Helicobacter sp. TaxID=175537 RepID=UPI002630B071|nr:DUF2603 domain-containing protein [uncultured Helicobacter sp.]
MATPKPLVKQINSAQQASNMYESLQEIFKSAKTKSMISDIALNGDLTYRFEDKNKQEFYLVSKKNMQQLLESAKQLEVDKYLFKLEQEIYSNVPIDFEDVWCIALKEIKNYKKEPKALVKNLKKRYPYLFFEISKIPSSL